MRFKCVLGKLSHCQEWIFDGDRFEAPVKESHQVKVVMTSIHPFFNFYHSSETSERWQNSKTLSLSRCLHHTFSKSFFVFLQLGVDSVSASWAGRGGALFLQGCTWQIRNLGQFLKLWHLPRHEGRGDDIAGWWSTWFFVGRWKVSSNLKWSLTVLKGGGRLQIWIFIRWNIFQALGY